MGGRCGSTHIGAVGKDKERAPFIAAPTWIVSGAADDSRAGDAEGATLRDGRDRTTVLLNALKVAVVHDSRRLWPRGGHWMRGRPRPREDRANGGPLCVWVGSSHLGDVQHALLARFKSAPANCRCHPVVQQNGIPRPRAMGPNVAKNRVTKRERAAASCSDQRTGNPRRGTLAAAATDLNDATVRREDSARQPTPNVGEIRVDDR